MNPLVSVIIPAHNAAPFVAATLDSALAQTLDDLEIIVVDDGSTDGTAEVLTGYRDRIRVLHQEPSGPSSARNRGAEVARGEWLAFLDADDLWREEKLERQLEIAGEDIDLVHTGTEIFGDSSSRDRYRSVVTDRGCLFESLLRRNFVTTSSVILRTDRFRQLGGFEEDLRYCEDWDLWLRFSAGGGVMVGLTEPLTLYRVHPWQTEKNYRQMKDGALRVLKRALAHPRARDLDRAVARRAIAKVWETMAWRAKPVARWTALGWYARSLWHDPTLMHCYRELFKCALGVD
jgi:glycosyltransferase involved in cell wall biosynthesis